MTSTTELSHVWQPLQVGPMRLKNRVIVPARVLNWSKTGVISDRHLDHYRELVAGGAAMIVTEQHAAYPLAMGSFHNPCSAWDRRAIPQFERFADIVHAGNVRGVVELFGTGVHDKGTMLMDNWKPLWGVSDIPSVVHTEVPAVLGKREIADIIDGFARSARNVQAGGLDGVEIHAGHGYLLCQFLSRIYNKRSDAYGGSIENRCRIIIEIGQRIRDSVGSQLAMGLRLSYDEFVGATGITPPEADEHVALFAETGLFDYFSISAGSYHTLHRSVAPMQEEDGHLVHLAKRAKQIVGERAAVITVGRIRDLHMAEDVLRSGAADLVALGRAQLADPHIVRKSKEGREHEIVRCTGVNECIGRLFDESEVICMMNPVTGREARWSRLASASPDETKRILVVGGGPAGLKVASTAASRGHQVTLVEERQELGGHLNLLAAMPKQRGWATAADDLIRAAENACVEIQLGRRADAQLIKAFDGDKIYLATGSHYDNRGVSVWAPQYEQVPGIHSPHVLVVDEAARRVLSEGGQTLGQHVVIIDESGAFLPLGLAELLAAAGTRTRVVTPQMFVGDDVLRHLELPWVMPSLRAAGVEFTSQQILDAVDGPSVLTVDRWSDEHYVIEDVSTVVLSLYRRSNTALFDEVADLDDRVERIGDSLAPRKLSELIYEGELVGRSI
jgi:2,4-dienoyl-CoA reductase-like NADH-dependent reductase (Old Yellow Enzyme family)